MGRGRKKLAQNLTAKDSNTENLILEAVFTGDQTELSSCRGFLKGSCMAPHTHANPHNRLHRTYTNSTCTKKKSNAFFDRTNKII